MLMITMLGGWGYSSAQLVVNNNITPAQIANVIVGAGFDVSNVMLNCPTGAFGQFDGTASNIGIPNGILLTTGATQTAIGPNNSVSDGVNNGWVGDNQLDVLAATTTYDACVLEFDLVPYCDTFQIKYVFASEEYPEFVGREFNDVFAFFISGPGIVGSQNVALLPGTTLPVAINSIHPALNQQYYVNNNGGNSIEYDGFTTVLTAKALVQPCETYHLKIVIADVADGIFDSGIFIEGGSVECSPFIFNDVAGNRDGLEGCTDGMFTFCRTGDLSVPLVVHYQVGGTATPGTDYVPILDSLVIPPGVTCDSVMIVSLFDQDNETGEYVQVVYQRGNCPLWDTLRVVITDPSIIDAGPDVLMCSGDQIPIGNLLDPTYTFNWLPPTGIDDPTISNPNLTLTNTTNFPVTYTYHLQASTLLGCILTDSLQVVVNPMPVASIDFVPVCTKEPMQFTDRSTSGGGAIVQWLWNFGDNFFDVIQNPQHTYNSPGQYTVTLTVTDINGCIGTTTQVIDIWALPVASFQVNEPCEGNPSLFVNTSTVAGANDSVTSSSWDFGDTSAIVTGMNPTHTYVAAGVYKVTLTINSKNGCSNVITKDVIVQPKPVAIFITQDRCLNDPARFWFKSIGMTGGSWIWDFGDGTTTDTLSPAHTYTDDGTYTVKLVVTSFFGCKDSVEMPIVIHPVPEPRFLLDSVKGCAPLCIDFSDTTDQGNSNIDQWAWLFGGDVKIGQDVSYCFTSAGDFSPGLMVVTDQGCRDTVFKQNYITVYPQPVAGFGTTPTTVGILNPVIQISDKSADGTSWIWDFGDGRGPDSTTTNTNPIVTYNEPGAYRIYQTVYNDYGCVDTASKLVFVKTLSTVYIPNAFTPSGDGINEGFIPKGTGLFIEADFKMYIYDRWGNQIFESSSMNHAWDGTVYNGDKNGGEIAQQDVYVYIARWRTKGTREQLKRVVGSVTLIR